ncbi:MAG: hypothetical protein LBV72_08390 [Tannerella sp.]|jgi:predicted DNA-binding WGR domain protein|nr:hypothetical protein [Tannerella sp.]
MKKTKLYDSVSQDNVCILTLDKTTLTIVNTVDGNTTTSEKKYDSEEEALDEYYETKWSIVAEGYNEESESIKATTELVDPKSDKICIISIEQAKLITENVNKGKSKITEKEFDSNEKAVNEYEKKVWATLKKGYIAHNEEAKPGEALLHRFLSYCYDGALGFENTPQGIYIYRPDKEMPDALVLLDRQGNLLNTIELPLQLLPSMQYHALTNNLYIQGWHDIYKYDLDTGEFTLLLKNENKPVSFLSVWNEYIAYGSHPNWILEDRLGKAVYRQKFDVKILSGSFPFCAVLSKNGKSLAMSCEEGKIQLYEMPAGKPVKIIEGDFPTVYQMEFVDGDKTLVVQESHGKWRIRYFNVETGEEIRYKGLIVPAYSKDTTGFCFNEDESLMVQQDNRWVYVFDYRLKKHLYTFELEHCVKRANVKFIDKNTLGVRTDYGCFSLYRI